MARPTRDWIIVALSDALAALLKIAEGQTSSPDARAVLRRTAMDAVEAGALVLQDELAFHKEKVDGVQQIIDATQRRKERRECTSSSAGTE